LNSASSERAIMGHATSVVSAMAAPMSKPADFDRISTPGHRDYKRKNST
jgi:hypothetical protein